MAEQNMHGTSVTVVIPNYNGLKFMEPCMAALEKQTCKDFEILVVDNGSSDGSVDWLRSHQYPTIFRGKYRILRCGKCGDQSVKNAFCPAVE